MGPLERYAKGGKVVPFITKGEREFRQQMLDRMRQRQEDIARRVAEYQDWKYDVGDRVRSPKTGGVYTILGKHWDMRKDRPMYRYETAGIDENTEGWHRSDFDALKAHELLELMTGPKKKAGGPLEQYAKGGQVTLPMRLYRGINSPFLKQNKQGDYLAGVRKADAFDRYDGMSNMVKNSTWWSSNPRTAESYVWRHGGARALLVPAYLKKQPDAVLDARGADWGSYFLHGHPKEFEEALRDPAVRAIMVQNVSDSGDQALSFLHDMINENPDATLDDLFTSFMGDNVLVKDHSVLEYLDRTPVKYRHGGRL